MLRLRYAALQLGGALGLLVGLIVTPAHAREVGGAEEASVTADKGSEPQASNPSTVHGSAAILLTVHSDALDVTPELVRTALERETGLEVRLQKANSGDPTSTRIVIAYRPRTRELAVSMSQPGRANTTRIVEAPKTADEVVNVAVLLAAHLARTATEEATLARTATEQPDHPQKSESPDQTLHSEASRKTLATAPLLTPLSGQNRHGPAQVTFATASLIYPIATNYAAPDVHTHLSFNLIYGHIAGLDGLELGLVNTVSETGRGVQVAGLANWVLGDFTGIELAGALNSAHSLNGLQVAFGANYVRQRRMGGQVAALANLAGGNGAGVALTLGLNSARSGEGLLLAGLANVNRGNFNGLTIAPVNWARDVSGVQLGIVNVGRKVKGVQLGLINIADDIEGVPLGLVSVTRSGGLHPMVWSSTSTLGNVGLKFATRYTYTFLNVSVKPNEDRSRIGPGFGLGASAPLLPKTFFEPDLGMTHLIGSTTCCTTGFFGAVERRRDETLLRLRASLRYEFIKHLSVFAGGGVVGRLTYPLDEDGNTEIKVTALIEGFGGVEL